MNLTRRQFLKRMALTSALGAPTALCLGAASPVPLEIVILGAGLAGLCAAYELERAGHTVTILEAEQQHVGGRVRTLRFGTGLYGEAGAMRIPASHHLPRHYSALFGLPLRRFVEFNPDAFYYVEGVLRRLHEVRHPSLRYAMQGIGSGPGSIWNERFDEIVGGASRLPEAFVRALRARPRMNCPVIRIEHGGRRPAAIYRAGGQESRVEGDVILCTIPFPVLRHIPVTPPLSTKKRHAIRDLPYGSAQKTLLLTRERFWELRDGIYGGASYTDTFTGLTYYPSDNPAHDPRVSARPAVLLASYTLADEARRMERIPAAVRARRVIQGLSHIHPAIQEPGMVLQARNWDWDHYQWTGGAFAQPGQDRALIGAAAAPEGRLHFAGEHTSSHATWMQGALESAHRAVREILAG